MSITVEIVEAVTQVDVEAETIALTVTEQPVEVAVGNGLSLALLNAREVVVTNDNASPITICQAVYVSSDDAVDLAQADAVGTMEVFGLVREASIGAGATGAIQTDGVLAATTGQWDTVTGGSGGLTAGEIYYLDPDTAGSLTTTAPTTVGQYVIRVGKALSSTEMEIHIGEPILL